MNPCHGDLRTSAAVLGVTVPPTYRWKIHHCRCQGTSNWWCWYWCLGCSSPSHSLKASRNHDDDVIWNKGFVFFKQASACSRSFKSLHLCLYMVPLSFRRVSKTLSPITTGYWLEFFHQPLPSTADLEKGATPPREKQPKGLLFIKSTSLVVCAREMGTFSTSSSATKPRMAALILSALKKP